ncbi:hypothetical protein [Dictyobacter kobayashii]|uniref:Uncharacterized protein n=1 Tax=Dictyobacter kobayashii TaxID=2014872 RepID=A0A402AC09_9CHLR|nr:hypothetical protein [Dictyobacter kobayashii]GCE16634.1 hypothetical protein KDK_04340 [Dictyobacter kobayashii]
MMAFACSHVGRIISICSVLVEIELSAHPYSWDVPVVLALDQHNQLDVATKVYHSRKKLYIYANNLHIFMPHWNSSAVKKNRLADPG